MLCAVLTRLLLRSLVLAILAAIVASQAMITSTFQLLVQVMRLSYFPHIKVVHTSKRFHEQVYMPMANWLLMIGTVVVTAVYNNVRSTSPISPSTFGPWMGTRLR